jgi:hypothetical protein
MPVTKGFSDKFSIENIESSPLVLMKKPLPILMTAVLYFGYPFN